MSAVVGVGLAVAKVALRLYGKTDVADILDDVAGPSEGFVARARRRIGQKDLGELICDRIESELPPASRDQLKTDPEAQAAAQIAADVVAGLAADLETLAGALARPEELPRYIRDHGGTAAKQQYVATQAETVYDQVLTAATRQLVALAPTSGRAVSAGMAEALRQLTQVLKHLDTISSDIEVLNAGIQELRRSTLDSPARAELRARAEAGELLLRLSEQYASDLDLVGVGANGSEELRLSAGLYVRRSVEDVLHHALHTASEPFEAMVVGEAGHGKSSLLWSTHRAMRGDKFEPLLVSSSWLLPGSGVGSAVDLELLRAGIEYLASRPRRLVALIDTADLLLHDATLRTTLLQLLADVRRVGASALVTVRPIEGEWLVSQGLRRLTLGPYDAEERAEAVNSLVTAFCPQSHPNPVAAIEAAEARGLPVAEVASNPLTLRLWFESSAPQFPSVEADVTTIYRLYWTAKVADDIRATGAARNRISDQSPTACAVAQVMMALGTPEPPEEITITYIRGRTREDPQTALLSLKRRGVLAGLGRRVRFFHQTLFEFAAAKALLADVEQSLAAKLLRRVLENPDDLFLGAVLEQYLIIAAEDPLRVDWCRAAIERLLQSGEHPLQDVALAAWAHHPDLAVTLDLLRGTSRWAVARFCRIAPSVTDLNVSRVLDLLHFLYQQGEPQIDHDILPSLARLARRAPQETAARLSNWTIFADVFALARDDRRAREEALELLARFAPIDPVQTQSISILILQWASEYSKRRKVTCALLEILAMHWGSVGSPAFLNRVLTMVEAGQYPLDRDSAEVRRSLGALLAQVWRSRLHEPIERWAEFVGPILRSVAEHPTSPIASAGLIAIGELLSIMDDGDPRIESCLNDFAGLPPNAIWEPSRHALPILAAGHTPASRLLLSRLADDLANLPAPPQVIEPADVLRAAVARQVILHPIVPAESIAIVVNQLKDRDMSETWTDPDRLLVLTPRAALGGVTAARHALPRRSEDLDGWSDVATKLLHGATKELATEDPTILVSLLAVAEHRLETSAIRNLLKTREGHAALRPYRDKLLEMSWRLLDGDAETAGRAGALLVEALAAARFGIPIATVEDYIYNHAHDPDARAALLQAVGLTAIVEPETWLQIQRVCMSLMSLTGNGEIIGTPRAFSSHREQVKVVEAARIGWLRVLSVKPFDAQDVDLTMRLAFAPSRVGEPRVRREVLRLLVPVLRHWVKSGELQVAVDTLISVGQRTSEVFAVNPTTQDKIANDLQPAIRTIVTAATLADLHRLTAFCKTVHPKWGVLLASTLGSVRSVDSRSLLQAMLIDDGLHGSIKNQITASLTARTRALGTAPFPEMLPETDQSD